jgi:peptide/nickel transport system substrate-binding protein
MASAFSGRVRRILSVTAGISVAALALAGCAGGGSGSGGSKGGSGGSIIVGTTDKVTTLDPAGSYDNGSFMVMNQVFPFLMNSPYGSAVVAPDIAKSGDFTSPTQYTVKLKPGLKWANGHKLTSSDVKFSFDRQVKINAANGPSSLLANLASVDAPDATTVVFNLKLANDQTFAQVLGSNASVIVDEEVFSPDAVTPDQDIVKGKAFGGQYTIKSYDFNNLISFAKNPDYQGALGAAKNDVVNLKFYAKDANLKLDIQKGNVDVATRSLAAADVADLRKDKSVKVWDGPGGEIRYIVFNFNTQPFGATTPQADPAKALAVRQAVANLINRQEISDQVYRGTYTPLFSFVAAGFTGATEVLKDMYGDGKGGPDKAKATKALQDAGVPTPVALSLQYNTDHYGPSSPDEYALIKDQLESSGLFKINLQSTEYVQYTKDRSADVYPAYQLGWFPDLPDADNYLTPFFRSDNAFLKNHYNNPTVDAMIGQEATTPDAAARTKLIENVQAAVAKDLPTVPYLQGSQVAVSVTGVQGITLDPSFKFRLAPISKG